MQPAGLIAGEKGIQPLERFAAIAGDEGQAVLHGIARYLQRVRDIGQRHRLSRLVEIAAQIAGHRPQLVLAAGGEDQDGRPAGLRR